MSTQICSGNMKSPDFIVDFHPRSLRVFCQGQAVLPVGETDRPMQSSVKVSVTFWIAIKCCFFACPSPGEANEVATSPQNLARRPSFAPDEPALIIRLSAYRPGWCGRRTAFLGIEGCRERSGFTNRWEERVFCLGLQHMWQHITSPMRENPNCSVYLLWDP